MRTRKKIHGYTKCRARELFREGKTIAQIADMFGVARFTVLEDTAVGNYERVPGSLLDGTFVIHELTPVRKAIRRMVDEERRPTLNQNEIERICARYAAGVARKLPFVTVDEISLYTGAKTTELRRHLKRSVIMPRIEALLADPETSIGEDAA